MHTSRQPGDETTGQGVFSDFSHALRARCDMNIRDTRRMGKCLKVKSNLQQEDQQPGTAALAALANRESPFATKLGTGIASSIIHCLSGSANGLTPTDFCALPHSARDRKQCTECRVLLIRRTLHAEAHFCSGRGRKEVFGIHNTRISSKHLKPQDYEILPKLFGTLFHKTCSAVKRKLR
jgi:hypothetical protein